MAKRPPIKVVQRRAAKKRLYIALDTARTELHSALADAPDPATMSADQTARLRAAAQRCGDVLDQLERLQQPDAPELVYVTF